MVEIHRGGGNRQVPNHAVAPGGKRGRNSPRLRATGTRTPELARELLLDGDMVGIWRRKGPFGGDDPTARR